MNMKFEHADAEKGPGDLSERVKVLAKISE